MKHLLPILALLLLSGCDPVKQVARKDARNAVKSSKLFNKADQKSHANVADLCGQRFPPVASTKDEIIPGETIVIHDTATMTIEKSGDTVIITYHDTVKVRRTDTVRQTIVKVNNAALYASQDSNTKMRVVLADKDTKIALSNQSRDGWRTKCLWTWGILAAIIILKIALGYIKSKTNILKRVPWL